MILAHIGILKIKQTVVNRIRHCFLSKLAVKFLAIKM